MRSRRASRCSAQMETARLFNNFNVPYHPGAIAYYKEKGIAESK